MRHRFIEAQDEALTNHGKFWIAQFGSAEHGYQSALVGKPLLTSLPPVRRFGGPMTLTSLLMVDLQTQEGMIFDPAQDEDMVRRRFLVHPLHVCILYFPLMMYLKRHHDQIWKLPRLVTLPTEASFAQPGLLLDATGSPVQGQFEWSRRSPLVARLRNREVPEGVDPEAGQGQMTEAELQTRSQRPVW